MDGETALQEENLERAPPEVNDHRGHLPQFLLLSPPARPTSFCKSLRRVIGSGGRIADFALPGG